MSQITDSENLKELKSTIINTEKFIQELSVKYKTLLKKKKKYEYSLIEKKNYEIQLSNIQKEIISTQSRYKQLGIDGTLKINTSYLEKVKIRDQIQTKISLLPKNILNELVRNKSELEKNRKVFDLETLKIINFKNQLSKAKSAIKKIDETVFEKNTKKRLFQKTIIEVEIQNVIFKDGYILIKINSETLYRFDLKESRKYLNIIKPVYKFRNAPKLIMETIQGSINRICNQEVLFYYITVLKFCNSFEFQFEPFQKKNISIFKSFSKEFYQKNLPNIFSPKCFEKLCKFSAIDLPIIPLPEIIFISNDIYEIHDSFIFPIIQEKNIFWIWESIENKKATYIFKSSINYESDLQKIFDYLTGLFKNKRLSIINNSELKKELNFIDRIYHTNLNEWNKKIESYVSVLK